MGEILGKLRDLYGGKSNRPMRGGPDFHITMVLFREEARGAPEGEEYGE